MVKVYWKWTALHSRDLIYAAQIIVLGQLHWLGVIKEGSKI